jgi:hypothetical protein
MAFATLPHKLLQPDRFESEVLELRKRFTDPKDPDYVFKPVYHKRIPADGVAPYMASIWVRTASRAEYGVVDACAQEQVMTNKDLDLPTQQELLAQFRCDELASAALAVFTEAVRRFGKPLASGSLVAELGKLMLETRGLALCASARRTSHQDVLTITSQPHLTATRRATTPASTSASAPTCSPR